MATNSIIKAPIAAIVVTYYPKTEFFEPLIATLLDQTDVVIVVDNTPGDANPIIAKTIDQCVYKDRALVFRFKENLGIGKAINAGCERAKELGAKFVLLSDQDSLPASDMVERLLETHSYLTKKNIKVAAVGPTYTDAYKAVRHPFQACLPNKFFYTYILPSSKLPVIEAISLITSGSLISIQSLTSVGGMREDFFMDLVDVEWCLRAKSRGYKVFGTASAQMLQRLGEKGFEVWQFGWQTKNLYSPARIYYQVRNFTALFKYDFIDRRWKAKSAWFKLGLVYAHTLFSGSPMEYLKAAFRGLLDGLQDKMGKSPMG